MQVTVRFFAAARAAAGVASTATEPGTLAETIEELTDRFPALAEVLPRCSFLVDATAVHGEPEEITVAGGSQVDILPPFAGG